MTRKRYGDEVEQKRAEDFGPLFAPPPSGHAKELGRAGLERAMEHNPDLLDRLLPVVADLLSMNDRLTITDVRKRAVQLGVLTGRESRHQLSALGGLMKRAGLVPTGQYRESDLDSTHGRPQMVWMLP